MLKINNRHILNIDMQIIYIDRQCHKKLPLNNFRWVEDISEFNQNFIKSYVMKVTKGIFLKVMFNILKIYIFSTMIYPFYLKEWELKRSKSL